MEQFVLVPASVYNKSLTTQSFIKQELPKYQPSQNPTYQVDSLNNEINQKLISKADSFLSCPRIKLSNSQTLILDFSETGVFCRTLLNNCVVQTPTFQTLILLDAAGISPTLILKQNAKAKERGSWVPFKI